MAHVSSHEDPGNTCLKVEWIARGAPSSRTLALKHEMLTGNEITLLIALDDSFEPISAGNSAGVNQKRAGGESFGRARFVVLNGDLLATVDAFYGNDT